MSTKPLFFKFIITIAIIFVIFGTTGSILNAQQSQGVKVRTVDFLARFNMKVNGAGPLLVKTDIQRNRIILVNTNTSSISIIDGNTHAVRNIPVDSRVPQYVKMEALALDRSTGNVYVIGNKSLHVVFPDENRSITINTVEQYEMVAVYEQNGNAFLVGRDSKYLAMVLLKKKKIKYIPWVDHTEKMINLNQTPPPPIRKVICDNSLHRIAAVDGFTSTLYLFNAKSGKLINKRKLPVNGGARWHMAGFNDKSHFLYTVIETNKREVKEAVKIDIQRSNDTVVSLPGLHEGVGMSYNPKREEVYIPYDNDPTVHVVDFKVAGSDKQEGAVTDVKVPTYGNDASAIDMENDRLYVASWGYGEIEVIDLKSRQLTKVIRNTGIIPHMFNIAFNPNNGNVYIPVGASAVNGSFGASLDVLNPESENMELIYTGWAPVALVEMDEKDGFMVFNSENEAAEVSPDGTVTYHRLPCRFINNALPSPSGKIYVSYGPHQSYWPTVYIWAAKNGVMTIDPDTMKIYDRRIGRMAQKMTFDKSGVFYGLQNNWGGETQFLMSFPDDVRCPNLGQGYIKLDNTVTRETTQRILKYDADKHCLYIVQTGETDDVPGLLQIYDIEHKQVKLKFPVGITPTDLVSDDLFIYITGFDDGTITALNKNNFEVRKLNCGKDSQPFKLATMKDGLACIDHKSNRLMIFDSLSPATPKTYALPYQGKPSNLFSCGDDLIITGHSKDAFYICSFNPKNKNIEILHMAPYSYGETAVDTGNCAFYMRGQFADGIFELNQIRKDKKQRLWITDYLSGKLFILE